MEWISGVNGWYSLTKANLLFPIQRRKLEKRISKEEIQGHSKRKHEKNVTSTSTAGNPVQWTGISGDPLFRTEQQSLNPNDQPY